MFTKHTIEQITAAALEAGVDPAALLAVAEVESGGRAYTVVDGRREPLIRFEGHYFDRRLSGSKRELARRAGLASPAAGRIANPPGQAARWRLLSSAANIDRKAAYESVSWGLGQVMGAHWAWLGYGSVEAFVAEMRGGVAGQAAVMARYIMKAGLADALNARDWERFARGYNGPGYRKHRYHSRLADAYRRNAWSAGKVSSKPAKRQLRRGVSGNNVRDLQIALSAAGYHLAADGRFGAATEAAVRRFQQDHGLLVDGIAGPQTQAALHRVLSPATRLRRWWTRLRALLVGWRKRRHN